MACKCGGKGCEECKGGVGEGADLGIGDMGAKNDMGGAEGGEKFEDVVSNVTDLASKVSSGEMTRAEAMMSLVSFIDSVASGSQMADKGGRVKPSANNNTAVDEENM